LSVLPAKRTLLRIWKTAQAVAANAIFGFPGRKLRVVGVTGTDGKTTTVHLIVTALESAGYTVGAVSTIQYQVGTRVWANTSKLTTPGPWALARLLAHMVRSGCHYVVLECSSHRLDQGGLWGIPIDVAVITNITREHLDYHRDLGDYAWAKRRLFRALRHPPKVLPYRRNVDRGRDGPAGASQPEAFCERCVMAMWTVFLVCDRTGGDSSPRWEESVHTGDYTPVGV
jgi:UDP-N-acetylmuramyl tripeptide synthase